MDLKRLMSKVFVASLAVTWFSNSSGSASENLKPSDCILGAWQLCAFGLAEDDTDIFKGSKLTTEFRDKEHLEGYAGCNWYYSAITIVDPDSIHIDGCKQTERGGPKHLLVQERRFLEALKDVNHFEIKRDSLRMYYEATGKMVFRRLETRGDGTN